MAIAAALVLIMQAGLAALEAGLCRPKNAAHVAMTRLAGMLASGLVFWIVGFGLLFGATSGGFFGHSLFFLDGDAELSGFALQVVFAATAAGVAAGALAERLRFRAYVVLAVAITGLFYPVLGHWVWAGTHAESTHLPLGWLARAGFVDFAGATVVHSLGGWIALAGLLIVGNRSGRYARSGKPVKLPGSSVSLATIGVFFILLGWLGWMAASTGDSSQVPRVILVTLLAAAAAGVATLLGGAILHRTLELEPILRGVLSGLVAISAGAPAFGTPQAVGVGVVAAAIALAGDALLARLRIDDAIGAIPVHLGAGLWGTVAVALFADPAVLGTGLDFGGQLIAQLKGAAACAVWGFGGAFLVLKAIDWVLGLRVSADEEFVGLNVSEHLASTELMDAMDALEETARHETPFVYGEPFAELAQLSYGSDGLVRTANPTASAIFGYAEREFARLPVTQLFRPNLDLPSLEASLHATARERIGLRRSGEEFPLEVAFGEGGSGQLVIKDITARKEAEVGLAHAEQQARRRIDRELAEAPIVRRLTRTGVLEIPGGDVALLTPSGADWFGALQSSHAVTLYAGEILGQSSSTAALLSSVLASVGPTSDYTHGLLLGDSRHAPERQARNFVEVLNRIVVQEGRGELRLALSVVHITLATGALVAINAGRRTSALVKNGRTVRELGGDGQPLGESTDPELALLHHALAPDDCLVFVGAGLVDSYSPDGSVLQAKELRRLISSRTSATEIRDEIAQRARVVWRATHDRYPFMVFRKR